MRTLRRLALCVFASLVAASPLLAHHDWPVDRTKQITVTGTVTVYRWADPHVMITLEVQTGGTVEQWNVGGSNKKYSAAGGWDKDTFKPGDVITATGFRYRDGSNVIEVRTIVMASGKEMYYGSRPARTPPPVRPTAVPTSSDGER
jgi:hypothetical protein